MDAKNNEDSFERSVKEYIEICEKCFRYCLKPGGPIQLSPGEMSCMETCVRRETELNKWKTAAQKNY